MLFSRHRTKFYLVLAALILLGASFFIGLWLGYDNRPAAEKVLNVLGQQPPPAYQEVDFNLFWEVWSRVEEKYVDKDKISRGDLVTGAISGLVKALKDPHSEFLPPAQTKQFQEDVKGSFEGIGAEIGIRRGVLTIIAPLKGNPAERAGLKAGDQILKINDTSTADLTLDEAVRLIRGPKGEAVRLMVLRNSFDKAKEFTVVRDTIRIEVVSTEARPDGIFVIKLNHFTQSSAFEFRKAVQQFYETNSQKLVLDLRNNPGGFLQVAVDIASWFLPAGETVLRERFASGEEEIYRSNGYRLLSNIPMVVLVNEGSASASEILAGALRDLKGVKLIGSKTFGKGSVQEVLSLPGGSSLKITIAKWLTPHGTEIDTKGLEPDIVVELPKDKEPEPDQDPVFDRAIEELRK